MISTQEKSKEKGILGKVWSFFISSKDFECKECGCSLNHHFHSKTIYCFGESVKEKYDSIRRIEFKDECIHKLRSVCNDIKKINPKFPYIMHITSALNKEKGFIKAINKNEEEYKVIRDVINCFEEFIEKLQQK